MGKPGSGLSSGLGGGGALADWDTRNTLWVPAALIKECLDLTGCFCRTAGQTLTFNGLMFLLLLITLSRIHFSSS